jgi:hypothetical protein
MTANQEPSLQPGRSHGSTRGSAYRPPRTALGERNTMVRCPAMTISAACTLRSPRSASSARSRIPITASGGVPWTRYLARTVPCTSVTTPPARFTAWLPRPSGCPVLPNQRRLSAADLSAWSAGWRGWSMTAFDSSTRPVRRATSASVRLPTRPLTRTVARAIRRSRGARPGVREMATPCPAPVAVALPLEPFLTGSVPVPVPGTDEGAVSRPGRSDAGGGGVRGLRERRSRRSCRRGS